MFTGQVSYDEATDPWLEVAPRRLDVLRREWAERETGRLSKEVERLQAELREKEAETKELRKALRVSAIATAMHPHGSSNGAGGHGGEGTPSGLMLSGMDLGLSMPGGLDLARISEGEALGLGLDGAMPSSPRPISQKIKDMNSQNLQVRFFSRLLVFFISYLRRFERSKATRPKSRRFLAIWKTCTMSSTLS